MISTADYKAILDRLDQLAQEMGQKLGGLPRAEQEGIRLLQSTGLPDFVISSIADQIRAARRKVEQLGRDAMTEVDRLLKEANAPFTMAEYDDKWQEIKAIVTGVASAMENPDHRIGLHWKGEAASKYFTVVTPQVKAANQAGVLAQLASTTLSDMASAGMSFYTAVCIAMAVYIVAAAAAIASIAGGPAVIVGIIAFVAASVVYAGAMATATFMMQGAQNKAATALLGAANDNTGFAQGPAWPTAVSGLYENDPNDRTDWEVRRRAPGPQPI